MIGKAPAAADHDKAREALPVMIEAVATWWSWLSAAIETVLLVGCSILFAARRDRRYFLSRLIRSRWFHNILYEPGPP